MRVQTSSETFADPCSWAAGSRNPAGGGELHSVTHAHICSHNTRPLTTGQAFHAAAMPGAASSMHSSDAAVNQQGGNVASTQGEFFRYVNAFTSQPSDENREIAQRLADNVRCALSGVTLRWILVYVLPRIWSELFRGFWA